MIQIKVPLNKAEINKESYIKYQIIWETQLYTSNKEQIFKSIEPNVKIYKLYICKTNIWKPFCTVLELDIIG